MTTIAVTGHMDLTEETAALVRAALRELLGQHEAADLVGVSCIAAGSDSLFAEAVLDAGGQLIVVVPGRDYRERKVKPDEAELYDRLVTAATEVHTIPMDRAGREAYEAAGAELLRRADRMVAIWDGQPSNGRGGTAHTVDQAHAAGIPVTVIWPRGAARQ